MGPEPILSHELPAIRQQQNMGLIYQCPPPPPLDIHLTIYCCPAPNRIFSFSLYLTNNLAPTR